MWALIFRFIYLELTSTSLSPMRLWEPQSVCAEQIGSEGEGVGHLWINSEPPPLITGFRSCEFLMAFNFPDRLS